MNITYILDQYGIDRTKLHQDIENQVLQQFQIFGPRIRAGLANQYETYKNRLAVHWDRRKNSPPIEDSLYDYNPPEFARRAINKVQMQETALHLYIIKHAIKFASSVKFEVISPNETEETSMKIDGMDWSFDVFEYTEPLLDVVDASDKEEQPIVEAEKWGVVGKVVSISILSAILVAFGYGIWATNF